MKIELDVNTWSKKDINRFSKLISLATIYMQGTEWDEIIDSKSKEWAEKEARRLKFPDGWQSVGEYKKLKEWYLINR